MTSAGEGSSAEGDATAARSRARESNQNQLKTDLPVSGLPERGTFQRRSWGWLFSGKAPPSCCSPLSRGGGAGGGHHEKGSSPGLLLQCPHMWPGSAPLHVWRGIKSVWAADGPRSWAQPTHVFTGHQTVLWTPFSPASLMRTLKQMGDMSCCPRPHREQGVELGIELETVVPEPTLSTRAQACLAG